MTARIVACAAIRTPMAQLLLEIGADAVKPAETHQQQAFHPKG
jgi:hypothetical protein